MPTKGYVIESFRFDTKNEYDAAKKEQEAILFIESKIKENDITSVLKVYNKLIDKKTFRTMIGYQFLIKLRATLLESSLYTLEEINPIPIFKRINNAQVSKTLTKEEESISKRTLLLEENKVRRKNLKVVNAFLIVLIVILLFLSYHDREGLFANYEQQVLNRYSTWQEELDKREKELIKREAIIMEKEDVQN